MKTIDAVGMKRPVCASCFEYPENCVGCEWYKCSVCGEELTDSETYEYRGAFACAKHHDDSIKNRDFQRQEVMAEVDHSVRSQADGEWQNGGYKTMKTDNSGRPITKIKEPMRLQQYERPKSINPDTCCIECKRYGTTPNKFPIYCSDNNCACHQK